MTGIDLSHYLIELARQAQASTDLDQQNALLKQFMDQSKVFLQQHPDQMLLWQLRAASAISQAWVNDGAIGFSTNRCLPRSSAASPRE